jgi:hypothetical protein
MDCMPISSAPHPEVACDVDTQTCIQLTTDDCPFVIGDYKATSGINPIFVGAFAQFPSGQPLNDVSYLNYALAQADFRTAGGIPAGSGSALRMPVFVACNNQGDITSITRALTHLTDDVHAPAVIAALTSSVLREAFSNVNLPASNAATSKKLFFMNPYGADSTLTSLPTGGLLWHILGQPSDLAAAYGAAFPRVEAYVRTLAGLGSNPMKVATVTPNSTLPHDLNTAVNPVLAWTGGPATAGNSNYLNVELSASVLDGVAVSAVDVSAAVAQLVSFHPDVVISYGCDEVINLIETLEIPTASNPAPPHPFYLLGPYNAGASPMTTWIGSSESKRTRVAGVNFATTQNSPVLGAYQAHFSQTYPNAPNQGDNYYDAAYFAIYALVAAGRVPNLTGDKLANGMPNLVYSAGPPLNIGPSYIGGVLSALSSLGTTGIALTDTIGPPQFNNRTGARITPGDIYCINRNQNDAGDHAPFYAYDALRLAAAGDSGSQTLEGTFPCYAGF